MKKERNPNACIIYCRVSYRDQVEGTSLESQERLCREHAQRQGLDVLAVFVEAGESAKTADRPELNRALTFCGRFGVGVFLVWKLDRFARNQDDHVSVRAVLRRGGTELRSVTEPIDNSPTGRMMEGMLSVIAEFDNNVRRERVKQGMLERVRQGVWMWPAPIGYMRPAPGANIIPDPATAPFIREIFQLYGTGAYTVDALAAHMRRQGFTAPRGGNATGRLIGQIITNTTYIAEIKLWGEHFEGAFQPLVARELFARCQPTQQPRKVAAPRSFNNPRFPLRGFLRCKECGRPLTGSTPRNRTGQPYPYYHHYWRECSSARFIAKDRLEREFAKQLQTLAFSPERAELVRSAIVDVVETSRAEAKQHNENARRQLANLEQERQRLYKLHLNGVYTDEEFMEQRTIVSQRIAEKRLLLREETGVDAEFWRALDMALGVLQRPAETWMSFGDDYRARLSFQKLLLPQGAILAGTRVRTTDLGLMLQLNDAARVSDNRLVDLLTNHWNTLCLELREWSRLPISSVPSAADRC